MVQNKNWGLKNKNIVRLLSINVLANGALANAIAFTNSNLKNENPWVIPNKSFWLFGSFIRVYLFYGTHGVLRSLCQDKCDSIHGFRFNKINITGTKMNINTIGYILLTNS